MKVSAQQGGSHHAGHAIESALGDAGGPTDEEWNAMDDEIARSFNEGSLIPGETLEETMRYLPEAIQKLKTGEAVAASTVSEPRRTKTVEP